MSCTKEFFLSVIQRIFSNWTALKMAVEYGMGPKERAVDFCPYIREVMYMNEGLNSSEIANELEDYMDEHFSTELEDNSAVQVAEELLRFYRYCIENNESLAMTELAKLSPMQTWLITNEPAKRIENVRVTESDSSDGEQDTSNTMDVVDEWTEVKSRRKR